MIKKMKLRYIGFVFSALCVLYFVSFCVSNHFLITYKDRKANVNIQQITQLTTTSKDTNITFLDGNELKCHFSKSELNNQSSYGDLTTDETVLKYAMNCSKLKSLYGFNNKQSLSSRYNKTYSIAYAIQIHRNIHQATILLSAIYTKNNVYCIHLDKKAPAIMKRALNALVQCFSNVFIASKIESVVYASIRRLQADINCMKDLLEISQNMYQWQYLINICGQDFPLKTNDEIIDQLLLLNGRNNIAGEAIQPDNHASRTSFKYKIEYDYKIKEEKLVKTSIKHDPPPFNMTIRKNLAYNVYTREFLQWALVDSKEGKALLEWSYDTYSPDEHFWLMLNSLPSAPGGSSKISWWSITPYIIWEETGNLCKGYWRNDICVFGVEDLPHLIDANKLFANKFDVEKDFQVLKCLSLWLENRLNSSSSADKSILRPPDSFFQKNL